MKIGIDISVLCNQWDGVGAYTFDILEYIKSIDTKEHTFYLYADRPLAKNMIFDDRFILNISNGNNHLFWLLFKLPKLLKRDKLDVFWQPNFVLPYKIGKMRNIVTVHDMSAYAYTEFAPWKTNIVHKLFLPLTCKYADKILTISNNAKSEIMKYLHVPNYKIQVIYNGKKMFKDGLSVSEEKCNSYLSSIGVSGKKYALFVGTLSPRKNDVVIIQAFLDYAKKYDDLYLILAGNIAKKSNRVKSIIDNSIYKNRIKVLGYISEIEKRILYYNASVLLYPSRLEGFGFPLLEGMQAQIPVITSNVSCMPEIAQDAAIYLNNIDDYKELSEKIRLAVTLSKSDKDTLVQKGLERVKYFDSLDYQRLTYNEIISICGE